MAGVDGNVEVEGAVLIELDGVEGMAVVFGDGGSTTL